MANQKGYYVVHGKSITTKRGIVAWDDPRPEITPKCMGADMESDADVKAKTEVLDDLVKRGALTKSEGVVMTSEPAREAPKASENQPPARKKGPKGGAEKA